MKKDLSYYLKLNYPIAITQDEEDGKSYYEAEIPDLPGCGAHGESIEEAIKRLDDAKKLWIEVSIERGLPIPEPTSEDEFSGKFLLRIPAKLHMQLTNLAQKEGISLNQYVRNSLEKQLDINTVVEKIIELSKEIQEVKESILEMKQRESLDFPVSAVELPLATPIHLDAGSTASSSSVQIYGRAIGNFYNVERFKDEIIEGEQK
jgi:antitoxin HicB